VLALDPPSRLRRLGALVRLASVASVASAVACGGAPAERAPAAPPAHASRPSVSARGTGVETFGEVDAKDLAELQGGAAGKPAASAAPAAEPDPGPADECAPVARAFERSARPKIKECYREGKKKDPNLMGSIKIGLEVDGLGKAKPAKVLESTLPKDVSACMLKAVKATPLPEASKCPNKSLAIPVTFPTP
jgi:hypothetical protein